MMKQNLQQWKYRVQSVSKHAWVTFALVLLVIWFHIVPLIVSFVQKIIRGDRLTAPSSSIYGSAFEQNQYPFLVAANAQGNLKSIPAEQAMVPTGTIMAWGGQDSKSIPSGWQECDGSACQSDALSLAIGSDTVPDLRGKVIMGTASGVNNAPASLTTGWKTDGTYENKLTVGQLPPHTHGLKFSGWSSAMLSGYASFYGFSNDTTPYGRSFAAGSYTGIDTGGSTEPQKFHLGTSTTPCVDCKNDAVNNIQPSFTLRYIIKL